MVFLVGASLDCSNAKDFRRHFSNLLFPHNLQQLTIKMPGNHQLELEQKDPTVALIHDNLRDHDNRTESISTKMFDCKERYQLKLVSMLKKYQVDFTKDLDIVVMIKCKHAFRIITKSLTIRTTSCLCNGE